MFGRVKETNENGKGEKKDRRHRKESKGSRQESSDRGKETRQKEQDTWLSILNEKTTSLLLRTGSI